MAKHVDIYDLDDLAYFSDEVMGAELPAGIDRLIDGEFLEGVLPQLTEREERVIRMRFGLGGIGEHTLREIGEDINLSAQAISRVESKALRRLRWYGCRAFPERAARAGFKINPCPVPTTLVQQPGPRDEQSGMPLAGVGAKPLSGKPADLQSPPPLKSGLLLGVVIGGYMAALGVDTTIAFQLATLLGSPMALLLCCVLWMSGLGIVLVVPIVLEDAMVDPASAICGDGQGLALLAVIAGLVGLIDPVQALLRDLVAATPSRFQALTPEIVSGFSISILLIAPVYLWSCEERKRILFRAV